jgi:endonuclease/exonuclease/phosphatase family metal-dependent hydrolase
LVFSGGSKGFQKTNANAIIENRLENSNSSNGSIVFYTFNTGLIKQFTYDVVPCVDSRIKVQVKAVFEDLVRSLKEVGASVAVLQEVWTQDAFNEYSSKALELGFDYFPKSYDGGSESGLMTISSNKIIDSKFYAFPKDVSARGIREHVIELNGRLVTISNSHTEFSGLKKINRNHELQLAKIRGFLKTRQGHRPIIFGADLNTGPKLGEYASFHYKLWDNNLVKNVHQIRRLDLDSDRYSWDKDKNTLISDPAKIIKIIYEEQGGWEDFNANFDHVFVSSHFENISTKLVFDEPYDDIECGKRSPVYLSDHFGVKSILKLVD